MSQETNNNESVNYNKLDLKAVDGGECEFGSLFQFYDYFLHRLYWEFPKGGVDYISFLAKNTDMDGDDIVDLMENLNRYDGAMVEYDCISSHFIFLYWDDSVETYLKLEHLVEALCCWKAKEYDFDAVEFRKAFKAFIKTKC